MDVRPFDLPDPRDGSTRASSRPPHAPHRSGADPDRSSPSVGVGSSPGSPDDEAPFPGWLYDDEPPERTRTVRIPRRRLLLIGAGIVPWVLVGLLALRPTGGAAPAPTPQPSEATAAEPEGSPSTPDAGGGAAAGPANPPRGGAAATVLGNPATAVTLADATSLATVVARDWIGGGPSLGVFDAPALPDAYVDHLEVEAVDHPAPGHAVVTLLAVVLRADDGIYDRAELRRVAVPVAIDAGGARPAGEPWWLAPPALTPALAESVQIDDPLLAEEVRVALGRAGYADVSDLALREVRGWPLVVSFRAVAPGATSAAEHTVWVRDHLGELVVAGSRPTDEEATP